MRRASFEDLSNDDRTDALHHVPRHALGPLVLAYCDWLSARSEAGMTTAAYPPASTVVAAFESLLRLVPNLPAQMSDQLEVAFPHGEAYWPEQMPLQVEDVGREVAGCPAEFAQRQRIVDGFVGSMTAGCQRRLLF